MTSPSAYTLLNGPRHPRLPNFNLHLNSAANARALLRTPTINYTRNDLARLSQPQRDGYVRLLDRNLITAITHQEPETTSLTISWDGPDAPHSAARQLVRHFGHGPLAGSFITAQMNEPQSPVNHIEAAVILAWHYRHTQARTLHIDHPSPHTVRITPRNTRTELPPLVLPATREMHAATAYTPPGDDYTDQGTDLPRSVVAFFATALAEDGPTEVHLDHLRTHPTAHAPPNLKPHLPGITLDALRILGAPTFTSLDDFTTWSDTNLTFSLRCGTTSHAVRFNPSTHRLTPKTNTVKALHRRESDHFLHALSTGVPAGCEEAQGALDMITNPDYYDRRFTERLASVFTTARVIARTVQYLDAGLDLTETAPLLKFALTAEQANRFLRLQHSEPGAARDLLLSWSRASYTGKLIEF